MVRVAPFKAIRPVPHKAAHVASLPYDVVTTAEARAMAQGEPDSFLHVVRSEVDLPEDVDPHDDAVYDQARRSLDGLLARGVLFRDGQPRMYLYRQVLAHRSQIGVVCCCHVDDYEHGVIKKHEKTRQDKEDDRTRHTLTLNANAGPVFLTHRDDAAIDRLVHDDSNNRPLYHFNSSDGVTHTIWPVNDPARYVEAFAKLPAVYVADGHHRSASAARAAVERRRDDPDRGDDEPYDWFLTVLFPAGQLKILPYNRVVADLRDRTPAEMIEALQSVGAVSVTDQPQPDRPGVFCIYLDGRWHRLELDPASIDRSDPIASLDVSLLQDRVLAPLLGIEDPRTDRRIDFIGGIRGTDALEQRVDAGDSAIAFSLYPTSIEQLLTVADADRVMPPKSTWFEPKLRSGLLVHELD